MIWAIEKTMKNVRDQQAMISALLSNGLDYFLADGDFATGAINGDSPADQAQPIVCYGSTRLMNSGLKHWLPAAFINDNFRHTAWLSGWGDMLLNARGQLCRFDDLEFEGLKFVRPEVSDKAFPAQIVDGLRLPFWKERMAHEWPFLQSQTMVLVADVRPLGEEARFFVVDGQIVAGSRYAVRGQRDLGKPGVVLHNFAEKAVEVWRPHDNFVIDIAETSDGPKVVEVNCLNTSGLYQSDAGDIVLAVTDYVHRRF